MRKKYRIKTIFKASPYPAFIVQVRAWWGLWVNVKYFDCLSDPSFARREAEELLDKLNE